MFERFTDKARRAIVLAEEEARRLHHGSIQPEHLLLALAQGDGIAARVMGQLGVSVESLRARVAEAIDPASGSEGLHKVPFSPRAKRTLHMALREALQLGHNYIGTEHILLGTMRESESDAGVVASVLGVGVDELRGRLLALIGRGTSPGASGSPALVQANRRADELAGGGPVTTGHVLEAMVADPGSQAGKVLQRLGLTAETVQAELSAVDVASTSDAPPAPRRVEIKLGETTMTIEDAEIVAAMEGLTADQLRAVLQKALGGSRKRRAAGSAG